MAQGVHVYGASDMEFFACLQVQEVPKALIQSRTAPGDPFCINKRAYSSKEKQA
jgi:hypothetical protein